MKVAERALFYWENEYIVSLLEANSAVLFPIVLPSLTEASNKHWNKSVLTMSSNILKNFMSTNQKVFDQVLKTVKQKKKAKEMKRVELQRRWSDIEIRAKKSEQYKIFRRSLSSRNVSRPK